MKKIYIIVIFFVLAILAGSYTYYQNVQKNIPSNIVKSNETILKVDTIRFTFKSGCMIGKSLNSIYSAKLFNNEDYIDEAIEYAQASLAFAEINYTEDKELLKYITPKIENILFILENKRLNINNKELEKLKLITEEINNYTSNREKDIWTDVQKNYINFRTDEVEKTNLFKTIILVTILLLVVSILFILFRKKAEKRQKSLIQKLDYAADEALAGYWEWHIDTNYLYLSKGWKKFLGYEDDELENNFETFNTLLHPEDVEPTINIVNRYLETKEGVYKAKFRLKHKDGTYKWISAVGGLSEGDRNIFFGFHIDIDDLTTTKQTLMAQSKSAMMGEMVGAIAHQIKQPISVISMIATNQLASVELQEKITDEMIVSDANENLNQVLYLGETIDTFKNFLKPDSYKTKTKVERLIDSSLSILDKSLKNNNIQVIKHFSNTKEILVYSSELMQVFINLINNSKDAFKTNDVENRIINITTIEKDENVVVKIEDTAGGIPSDKINNIFDAYFTTKSDEEGTGLGLYIVKTIIEEHYNGSIEVQNTQNGVLFKIVLPV